MDFSFKATKPHFLLNIQLRKTSGVKVMEICYKLSDIGCSKTAINNIEEIYLNYLCRLKEDLETFRKYEVILSEILNIILNIAYFCLFH